MRCLVLKERQLLPVIRTEVFNNACETIKERRLREESEKNRRRAKITKLRTNQRDIVKVLGRVANVLAT